jgi:hypothetical protein
VKLGAGNVDASPASLKINVAAFKYDIGGNRGVFDGYSAYPVPDESASYVYLDSTGSLTHSTSAFPSTPHIPLARVVTTNGEIVAVHEERLLMATSSSYTGTCKITYPVDGDIKGGDTTPSSNNNWAAVYYAASGTAGEARNRWVRRPPQNYVSGDFVMRLYCSVPSSVGNNKDSFWRLSYKFASIGEALGTMDSVTANPEHDGQAADELFIIDLTIPEANVDVSKDLMAFYLAREYDNAGDNCPENIYIHNIELRYTGTLLAGQAGQ